MSLKDNFYRQKGLSLNLNESILSEDGANPAELIYRNDTPVIASSGIKKALWWLLNKTNDALSLIMATGPDPDAHEGRLHWNGDITRRALINKFGEEVAKNVESKYRESVISASKQLGMEKYVEPHPENFGGVGIHVGATDIAKLAKEMMLK